MPDNFKKIKQIAICGLTISVGLLIFKYLPMLIWGKDILFDASAHIAIAIFVLYVLWFFIDQNQKWRTPYIIFCIVVLTIISLQRILVFAHNDFGLLMGLILGLTGVGVSRWKYLKDKIDF